jgi:hypothetical protein
MAMIKPPAWCADAIPGKNGWTDAKTGEVYQSNRFTQAQIDEFMGVSTPPAKVQKPVLEDLTDLITEGKIRAAEIEMEKDLEYTKDPDDISNMNKKELEKLAREHGVELDRRKSKKALLTQLRSILK